MLKRKMFRDIRLNASQFITIFLMVFIGVMAYSGIESYMTGMENAACKFYKENNLQDLNVIGNFKASDLDDIKKLEHVNDAEVKLTLTANVSDDSTLQLSFIDENNISKFYVIDGVGFDYDKDGIWLDNFYAAEHKIKVGDVINFTYDGYNFKKNVLGFINVPDHIYDVKDSSQIYPNHYDFGFAYLSSKTLYDYFKEKYNSDSIDIHYNNIMVDVDSKDNLSIVKSNIENNISNAIAVTNIEDTASYTTYQGEIDEGKTYIGVFSGLFIFIAMLSVATTMMRIVKDERIQIGTLKALGFKNRQIIFHYLGYGFIVSIIASLLGLVAGYYLIGKLFIGIEMSFFEIPNGVPVIKASSFICALCVVLLVLIVTYVACHKQLVLNAAEALRNRSSVAYSKSLDITTKGLFKKMSFITKWNLRDMIRNKIRTITGIVGITGCCMLVVCAFGMLDSINNFIDLQFRRLYNFDYKLSLKSDITDSTLQTLEEKYGTDTSQSYLIEIKDSNGDIEANNIFINDASDKVRFIDSHDKFISLDDSEGVYITYKLAKKMNYKIGDTITWHLVGNKNYYESKIVGFNKDPQNQNMTVTREYFESLGNTYKPDSLYTNIDLSMEHEINGVEVIQNLNDLESGMSNMLSTMKSMISLIIAIALILGFVIIYNMGILSYTEKQYQFATLKVLGFQDSKVKKIFSRQNMVITICSIIIGLPLGYYLTDWIFRKVIEESYDFSAYITINTYLIAIVSSLLVTFATSKILARKITKIDMVSSLKGNE